MTDTSAAANTTLVTEPIQRPDEAAETPTSFCSSRIAPTRRRIPSGTGTSAHIALRHVKGEVDHSVHSGEHFGAVFHRDGQVSCSAYRECRTPNNRNKVLPYGRAPVVHRSPSYTTFGDTTDGRSPDRHRSLI